MGNALKQSAWAENQAVSIKKMSVESGKIHFILADHREVIFPVRDIPEIKKLTPAQRKKFQVFGEDALNLFSFEDSDSIFKLTDDLRIIAG